MSFNYPIEHYADSRELDKAIATELITEFKKQGLILLASGKTFEGDIYKYLNEYYLNNPQELHPQLRLSHIDELLIPSKAHFELEATMSPEDPRFSVAIRRSLPSIVSQRPFFAIDPRDPKSFEQELYRESGPRRIYLGLGADPSIAHIALIAEAGYINSDISLVSLNGFDMRNKYKYQGETIKEALTIGTDLFRSESLSQGSIVVVVKGKDKAPSLRRAFEDTETGLGYMISHYSHKLRIVADAAALQTGLKNH